MWVDTSPSHHRTRYRKVKSICFDVLILLYLIGKGTKNNNTFVAFTLWTIFIYNQKNKISPSRSLLCKHNNIIVIVTFTVVDVINYYILVVIIIMPLGKLKYLCYCNYYFFIIYLTSNTEPQYDYTVFAHYITRE